MRNRLAAVLLIGVAGCHLPGVQRHSVHDYRTFEREPYSYAGHDVQDPLRASLWFNEYTGRASFTLSRPAYVAIFALEPMGAVEMLYPFSGHGRGFRSGSHSVFARGWTHHRAERRGGWGTGWGTSWWNDYYGRHDPTYILLIAADRPLELNRFLVQRPLWLNETLLPVTPYSAAQAIVGEILPYGVYGGGPGDWTVDYQVIWPDAGFRADRRSYYTRIHCPNGTRIFVPLEALRIGWFHCPVRDWDRRGSDRPDRRAKARSEPRVPSLRTTLAKRPRPRDWTGATPTRPLQDEERGTVRSTGKRRVDTRPEAEPEERPQRPQRSEPRATPRDSRPLRPERPDRRAPTARPAPVPTRPAAEPQPRARPRSRPAAPPKARPRPEPRPQPTARPQPAPRARPKARPAPARPPSKPARPAPRPTPKKKKKGGGG